MNWPELPLLRILLPFIAGIIAHISINHPIPISAIVIGIGTFIAILYLSLNKIPYRFRHYFGYLLSIYLFLFAYSYTWCFIDVNKPNHFKHSTGSVNTLIAKVISVEIKAKRTQLLLQAIRISSDTLGSKSCSGNLMLSFSNKNQVPAFLYGDQLILKGNIQKIKSSINPKAFNYALFLNRKNIFYQIFAQPEDCQLLKRGSRIHPMRMAAQLQAWCMEVLRKHLQHHSEWMVGKALLFGHRSDLDQQIKRAYTATGAIHVLAVSGLHVGIICLMLQFFLQFLDRNRIGRWLKTILSIIIIWFFALFTGASSSVLRAAMLFSFVLIGQAFHRNSNINNTLAASALLLLCFNPLLLFDVGFQLSYSAVLGIIHFQGPIYRQFYFKDQLLGYFWKISSVSFAAQLGTLPISIYYFHQFPSYFWLSGLLLIPAAFLIIALGISMLVFQGVPILAFLLGKLLDGTIWICNRFIFFLEGLPGHLIKDLWLSRLEVITIYFILLSFLAVFHFRKSIYYLILSLSLCLLSASFAFTRWQRFTQKEIVIYAARGYSIVDFIDGHTLISLESPNLEVSTIGWSAANYRSYKTIRQQYKYVFDSLKTANTEHWYYQNGFIQFFDLTMAIPNDSIVQSTAYMACVDILLMQNNTKADLDQMIHDYTPRYIIIDQSNDYKTIRRWEAISARRGRKTVNINQSGAFKLIIKNHKANEKDF